MPVIRADHAVILTAGALDAARYAVEVAQRARRRNGLSPSTALAALLDALSPGGQTDTPDETTGEADDMTTHEAAAQLRCSDRQVRRLAPGLGGRLVGGRWLLDRQAVTEHQEGLTA